MEYFTSLADSETSRGSWDSQEYIFNKQRDKEEEKEEYILQIFLVSKAKKLYIGK